MAVAIIRTAVEDGSHWIRNLADQHLPGAAQIGGPYHAREHLPEPMRRLDRAMRRRGNAGFSPSRAAPKMEILKKRWALRRLAHANTTPAIGKTGGDRGWKLRRRNARVIPTSGERASFVGSKLIEAGCKSAVGWQIQRSGMSGQSAAPISCLPAVALPGEPGWLTAAFLSSTLSNRRLWRRHVGSVCRAGGRAEAWRAGP
jgi:hypothetical protein